MSSSPAPPRREAWLDIARVLAIFLIIVFHLRVSTFSVKGEAEVLLDGIQLLFNRPSARLSFFFLLAGYFMHARLNYRHWLTRMVLLLCAYLLWNTLCLLPAQCFPAAAEASGGKTLAQMYGVGSASKFCIDYPLWFIRALLVMMLFVPLMRFFPLLWAAILLGCAYLHGGREWLIGDVFAMPEFSFWCLFALGMACTRFDLGAIRRAMPRVAMTCLVFWPVVLYYKVEMMTPALYREPSLLVLLSLYHALVLVSLGYVISRVAPRRLSDWIVSFAPSSFLAFAWHALWIVVLATLLSILSPPLLSNSLIILIIPIVIIWMSRAVDRWLTRRFPRIAMFFCNKVPPRKR